MMMVMVDDKVIKITMYGFFFFFLNNNKNKNYCKIFFGFLNYRLSFRNLKCLHFVILTIHFKFQ